jgi:hypothetical protein
MKLEKADEEKLIGDTVLTSIPSTSTNSTTNNKRIMQVHPLLVEPSDSNKYNTFVVKKSPRASPKERRKNDPLRYITQTIIGKALANDANGNPLNSDLKFATFRVGSPKIIKNSNTELESSNSTQLNSSNASSNSSTPGSSPKIIGIRGRRKNLSLPSSAIARQPKIGPQVPKKPTVRTSSSPSRSTTSSIVYVRPTKTSELRGRKIEKLDSRNSSNSSLHNNDCGVSTVSYCSSRSKSKPTPPPRTTASIITPSVTSTKVPIQLNMKVSSSFGFDTKRMREMGGFISDGEPDDNMKGYNTLPTKSKCRSETPFSLDRYSVGGESKESIPGSERSSSKIKNFWKKMDFRNHNKLVEQGGSGGDNTKDTKKSLSNKSKLQNFFGRGKKTPATTTTKVHIQQQQQPFPSSPIHHPDSACTNFSAYTASASTGGVLGVRKDGGKTNKVIVPPFNYTPPDRSSSVSNTNGKETVEIPATSNGGRTNKITTV